MAPPPISNTSPEPTLYDILSLTPKHLEGHAGAAQQHKIVKQAYHRALLKHHPDKTASSGSASTSQGPPTNPNTPSSSSSPSSPTPTQNPDSTSKSHKSSSKSTPNSKGPRQPRIQYTVDQIQHAYSILSDAQQRASYNRALRTAPPSQRPPSSSFQTGVETVDLDDISFDERAGVYHRACRCGNKRGYAFAEANLEQVEDDGVLMVECLDCSLWIRVLFAAADEDSEPENAVRSGDGKRGEAATMSPAQQQQQQQQHRRGAGDDAVTTRDAGAVGERRGSGNGRGFTFNWSFNWGISLSGSATASNSRR
ncbi:hypothetical protein GGR54DRAFT_272344 [Hypoxylon sp. NC1633]|nr:hypothetical protein GGR54DRAFT_272344 [Hypoxylon sp. NC1633]